MQKYARRAHFFEQQQEQVCCASVCVLMHFNQFVRHLASPQMQMILAYCKHTHARASLGSRSLALALSQLHSSLIHKHTHTGTNEICLFSTLFTWTNVN